MKRGRRPTVSNTGEGERQVDEINDLQNQNSGRFMTDLPSPITFDILLRVSVKGLLICKCVCKTWRNLILDPKFATLHFARGEAYPLIRTLSPTHVSRTLYLFEDCYGIECGPCPCDHSDFLCHGHIKVGINTKLKIPLRNAELLTLNEVTGEYIVLPDSEQPDKSTEIHMDCGLGFSLKANKFKVIRIFNLTKSEMLRRPIIGNHGVYGRRVAEIHTLGTGSWKRIGIAPCAPSVSNLGFPTYLNGAIHWLCSDLNSDYIISFNFDNEKFQSFPPPPPSDDIDFDASRNVSLGVLGEWLCICNSEFEYLDIWVMKDYGTQESWSKDYCIDTCTYHGRWLRGLYEPMSYLRNGAILLFHRLGNAVVYYDPKIEEFYFLKLRGIKSKFEAIAHTPSFISLKDAVGGGNLAVLNIKSRCAEVKLPGETKAVFLNEENVDFDSDFNLSD
ncbi:hypothetical protein RHMOL_Rhmol07G0075600 [Rhododendron molle]|uniref:Uncharacterized protein n=1 Tax=Rhododendron molle TaxID=49168 RepID=A0ACC0MZ79_RHOML|nr:hypothetical protein RHMOL_Rhmol07G0075600 [Rhododendron molle]